MNYRIVLGADEAALNTLAKLEYNVLYPGVFKRRIPIGKDGLTAITYDVTDAPTFDLAPPGAAPPSPTVPLSLRSQHVTLVAEAADGSTHTMHAAFTVLCNAEIGYPNHLAFTVVSATLVFHGTPPDTTLQFIMNHAVLPVLVQEFDTAYLNGATLPLQFGDVVLATPILCVENRTLLVFASTTDDPPVAAPAPGTAWPTGRAFMLGDLDMVDTFIEYGFIKISKTGYQRFAIGNFNLSASYFLGLEKPLVSYAPGNPFDATLRAAGAGVLEVWLDGVRLEDVHFEASATPKFSATATVAFPDLHLKFDAVSALDVAVSFPYLPPILRPYLTQLIRILNSPLTTILIDVLLPWANSLSLPIPSVALHVGDLNLVLAFSHVDATGIVDSDGTQRIGFVGDFSLYPS